VWVRADAAACRRACGAVLTRRRAERQVPGCYALSVTDKIAEDVMEQMDE